MTDWAFIVVPLLVLPIVLLFRFIGCGYSGVATGSGPDKPAITPGYRATIMAETSVIGYWRLVDDAFAKKAKDEIGPNRRDGEYRLGPALLDEKPGDLGSGSAGSEGPAGGFSFPSQPGLIASDPTAKTRLFSGGHVRVPYTSGLYTDEFTIEAWIEKGWQQKAGYQHVLFSAGGRYAAPLATDEHFHGFMVFANGEGRWEVQFFTDDGVVSGPSMPLPIVPSGKPTHIAVIVKNEVGSFTSKIWDIYVDGKVVGPGTVKSYSRPDGAPLFIGVGGRTPDKDNPNPRFPILSRVQEVVLHNKALSQEEIQNHVKINV